MKTILKSFLMFLGVTIAFSSCSDWTETEIKDPENLTDAQKTEEYYENLRAYKNTDHPVAFGWFGEWVGSGASLEHSLRGLPDSVDFVSIWGNWKNLDEARIADKKYVKEVKGTRAMVCFIVQSYGDQLTPEGADAADFWLFGQTYGEDVDLDSVRVVNYANAICDTIDKYDYDGFDYDYEPNYGHSGNISKSAFSQKKYERIFVRTLAKRLGPLSGTGRLLVMDGEPQTIAGDLGECFDYFIVQAYACTSASNLDSRIAAAISNLTQPAEGTSKYLSPDSPFYPSRYLTAEEIAKKYIVTENFESYAATGGVSFTDRNGNVMRSLEGMARWQPIINGRTVQKGGIGTYRMQLEYKVSGFDETYPYLRKGIHIMNPVVK